ncbi:serine hydrolase domain-containing protein [Halobacillus mangrovi]|uniref:Penicillin-binding protein n=1 Tax=Halobacillus mangrovi TaxID=402384 RepID=A0A1W6A0M0_9BACI|nr:penicillin-binding protein [Halobacillus mangrovi]
MLVKDSTAEDQGIAFGWSNRAERLENNLNTKFGIASGCKVFTAVAICQLIEEKKLQFDTQLYELLAHDLPLLDPNVTIHHLLTHTSGMPDYFDEDKMENFDDLWKTTPMYTLRQGKEFLPFFQIKPMKFKPGERFHYNNAGYIVLGLVVELLTGKDFQEYVEENVFTHCGMVNSRYYEMDKLPENTAMGYIQGEDGWKSNIYSVPVKGGADGGAFVTAVDMIRFWEALIDQSLLSEDMSEEFLKPKVRVKEGVSYGYGLWINTASEQVYKYHVMGYDPGVSFHSCYYPAEKLSLAVLSNRSSGAYEMMKVVEDVFSKS